MRPARATTDEGERPLKHLVWPAVGLIAVAFSGWLLYHEVRGLSLEDVGASLAAIPLHGWLLAAGGAMLAYATLAAYDHIALLHLGRKVPFWFITACAFTTYALSHNIGGSLLSGAVIRYRAYSSWGLTMKEVGVLVALTSLTFTLSSALILAFVLIYDPMLVTRFIDVPPWISVAIGTTILALVALYVLGSWQGFRPLHLAGVHIHYPKPGIVMRQLMIGPFELIGAAAIFYFTLPAAGNPGFVTVLGVFVFSLWAVVASHAPGGLGVLELFMLSGLSDIEPAAVLASLAVFRLFYLIVPLALSLVTVVAYERGQLLRRREPGSGQD